MSDKALSKFAFATLISVYLVIIAGSVVRSTGSGMGCPDWPKCFGYYIPPTDEDQVKWKKNQLFEEGQMIVAQESLWKANSTFTSQETINFKNWDKYTKHDYAKFNVAHTWTEYVNRLTGAISGFMCLLLVYFSFKSKRKNLILFSLLILAGMVFQAWLGATVVFSVLAPHKITIHMLMALLIVWWIIVYIEKIKINSLKTEIVSKTIKNVSILFLAVTLAQIVLGTQVRQEIDIIAKQVGESFRDTWMFSLSNKVYIHIFLAYALIALGLFLFIKIRKSLNKNSSIVLYSLLTIFATYLVGIILRFAGFPAFAQPLHLLLSTILFGFQMLLFRRIVTNKTILKF